MYGHNPNYKAYRKVYDKAYSQTSKYKEYSKKYKQSPNAKASDKAYRHSLDGKLYQKTYAKFYRKTPKGKAVHMVAVRKNKIKRLQAEGSYTAQEWLALKEQYGNICLCCKRHESERPLQQDHIVPITKGGSNWITNIQPLCGPCKWSGRQSNTNH